MATDRVVATYKSLARVERDFRSIKAIDLQFRPIYTEARVRAHVFLCMLAAYLVWHLRQVWAPLTFTDEHRPSPTDPSPPRNAPKLPTPKHLDRPTTPDPPCAPSGACSSTWPP